MSDARAQELLDLGNNLFTAKQPLDDLCQEIADNVRPERADFTVTRNLGDEFASHLNDSFPIIACRELGNSFSAILRPRDKNWFAATTNNESLDQDAGNARFLEYISREVRSAVYDPRTDFIGATKMVDQDFAAFGNGILSIEEYRKTPDGIPHLFFRPHHLRDCAWLENDVAVIDHLHRKDRMTARAMKRKFGEKNLHQEVLKACEKEPHREFELRVVVMPADEYDYVVKETGGGNRKGGKLPFVIIYIDASNCKVVREAGLHDFIYMVARWHRIPGFQYAFSPASMTALPDARMAQELALLILEAGEKSVHPPTVADYEAIQQANMQAGSISWADLQGDRKVSDVMAMLPPNADMKVGFEMRQDVRELITRSFFLDKLRLPDSGAHRTAYEIARIIEDHVRNLLPLFEPMEVEYNTKMLDKAFNALVNMQRFDWSEMPESLMGRDMFWSFKNPMQEASSRILVSQFQECMALVMAAQQMGVKSSPIKVETALDDAIRGTSAPATWRKTEEERAMEEKQAMVQEMIAGAMQDVAGAAGLAGQVGDGMQRLQGAGVLPQPLPPIEGGRLEEAPLKALPPPRAA